MRQLNNENAAVLLNEISSLLLSSPTLLSSCGLEAAQLKDMVTNAKRNYVQSHHNKSITKMSPNSSWKNGCYKTYVYVDSKRKEMIAATEDKLIEKLYTFYYENENKAKSLEQVFEMYLDYKKTCLNRSDKTINTDRMMFRHVSENLRNASAVEITDEDIRKYIVSDYLAGNPKPESLKRMLQLLRAVFDYGIRNKICPDNPLKYIIAQDYYKYCSQETKTDEEKAFSAEELARITEAAEKDLGNPRVLMSLLAKETGLRAGELCALHKEDIEAEFIHVHRQQVYVNDENGGTKIIEVPYTKDERMHPHDGRRVPITEDARKVIELALQIPGDSPYLFHDADSSGMVPKDGYCHNLRKRCKRLGCMSTNNHAFRMAFNSRLIEMGFSPSDRALILGHEVQTNEAHYSLTDKRRLEDIKKRLTKKEP